MSCTSGWKSVAEIRGLDDDLLCPVPRILLRIEISPRPSLFHLPILTDFQLHLLIPSSRGCLCANDVSQLERQR